MHPIEHLRYLARAGDADPTWLLPEAAGALGGLADDRNALVMASRKLLERFPLCAPLWWLCTRALTAPDPLSALEATVETFESDPTGLQLSLVLTDAETPPVVSAAVMATRSEVIVARAAHPDAPDPGGPAPQRPSWVIVGVGTLVADQVFQAATAAATDVRGRLRQQGRRYESVPIEAHDAVIGPTGSCDPASLDRIPDVTYLPELSARS